MSDKGHLVAGHYRLLERIGTGAMGVVWQARDERLDRIVAIKQLLLQPGLTLEEGEEARHRALREARIAARLHHPNAITVFDVADDDGKPCLVLEYLPSRSLATVLAERGSLPPREVAAIGGQVAAALAAAHAVGIVHRDIKPGNILINDSGTAKITDFGISRATGDVTVTKTGMLTGTPAYLSPDVVRGDAPSPASDVFSLGATLYTAVEGRPPFGSMDNTFALLHAVAGGKVQPPQQAGPLTALLMSLLRVDPDERPTMAETSKALNAVAAGRAPTIPSRPATAAPVAAPASAAGADTGPAPTRQQPGAMTRSAQAAQPAPSSTRVQPTTNGAPPPRPRSGNRRRRHRLITAAAGVAAVLLLAVVVVWSNDWFSGRSAQPSSVAPTPTPPPAAPPPPPPPAATTMASDGTVSDWSAAGQLVIDYYNGLEDLDYTWEMLSPYAREQFGGRAGFNEYWSQFSSVSAWNAFGVTTNPDGSVNVPVDVTYNSGSGSVQHKRVLRIIKHNGELLIDSEAR